MFQGFNGFKVYGNYGPRPVLGTLKLCHLETYKTKPAPGRFVNTTRAGLILLKG